MAKKPFGRGQKPDHHSNQSSARNDRGSARKRDRAGDLAEAAMDAGAGGAGGGIFGRLPTMQMLKMAVLAYASYRGGGALATFWNDLKNGTPYDLRENAGKGSATGESKGGATDDLQKNLATSAGKEGLAGGDGVTKALDGRGSTDLAINSKLHAGIDLEQPMPPAPSNLAGNMKDQVVRLALPGRGDRTIDFALSEAGNDASALAEFQRGYPAFASKSGLPSELPVGSSLSIGVPSSGMFASEDKTAREYRLVGEGTFERNSLMTGSLDTPGEGAWRVDPAFKAKDYRFDASELGQDSANFVQARTLSEQASSSSLLVQRQALAGALDAPVSTPVSVGNRLLGQSPGSDFEDLVKGAGLSASEASMVKSHDFRTGTTSVGVEAPNGAVMMQTGATDKISAARHGDGASVFVSYEAAKGSLGAFGAKGEFVGKEAASGAFDAVGKAAKGAEASPVLAAANAAGVEGRKAVFADIKGGHESQTTRVAYEGRVVDYHAKNGSLVIVERDPATHEPKDASIIRSQGIRLKDGKLELDSKSNGLLREHVELASQGRSEEFGARHPAVKQQFASLGEGPAKVEPSASLAKADAGGRSHEASNAVGIDPGGASKIATMKEVGLQELNAPAPVAASVAAVPKARAGAMEIGG